MLGEGNVEFTEQNANGDSPTCATIINGFVSSNVDLILANATAPLQAAAAGTDTIPVIGTSVTDYATALAIDDWTGTTGRNITGTSDLAPLDQQAEMIQELFPRRRNGWPPVLLRRTQLRISGGHHRGLPHGNGVYL